MNAALFFLYWTPSVTLCALNQLSAAILSLAISSCHPKLRRSNLLVPRAAGFPRLPLTSYFTPPFMSHNSPIRYHPGLLQNNASLRQDYANRCSTPVIALKSPGYHLISELPAASACTPPFLCKYRMQSPALSYATYSCSSPKSPCFVDRWCWPVCRAITVECGLMSMLLRCPSHLLQTVPRTHVEISPSPPAAVVSHMLTYNTRSDQFTLASTRSELLVLLTYARLTHISVCWH